MLTGTLDAAVALRAVGVVLVVGFGGLALGPSLLSALHPAVDRTERRVVAATADLGVRVRVVDGPAGPTAAAVGVSPRTGTVFLSRSLVSSLSPAEVRAVAVHEAGHLYRGHTLVRVGLPSLYVLGWVAAAAALGAPLFWAGVVGALPVALVSFRFARWTEFDADAYAAARGHGPALATALTSLDDAGYLRDGGGVLSRHPALAARVARLPAAEDESGRHGTGRNRRDGRET